MVIWFAEDLDRPEESGFGRTKKAAQAHVSGNRGYDDYTGHQYARCVRDGWARFAVRIDVHPAVAAALLATMKL